MVTTLGVAEEIDDYGSTHGEDLVVPLTMLERNHHPTSSKHPSIFLSWKTKKVMLGIIGLTAAVVVTSATLFFSGPQAARTGPSSVLLQHYPYVTINNKTPYDVRPSPMGTRLRHLCPGVFRQVHQRWCRVPTTNFVRYSSCTSDLFWDGLPAGQTWTASSRGLCLVNRIYATLSYQIDGDGWLTLTCAPYTSSGTAYSIYSIIMKGDDACCVLSSHEIQKCP